MGDDLFHSYTFFSLPVSVLYIYSTSGTFMASPPLATGVVNAGSSASTRGYPTTAAGSRVSWQANYKLSPEHTAMFLSIIISFLFPGEAVLLSLLIKISWRFLVIVMMRSMMIHDICLHN